MTRAIRLSGMVAVQWSPTRAMLRISAKDGPSIILVETEVTKLRAALERERTAKPKSGRKRK